MELKEKITPHLRSIIDSGSDAVARQFICSDFNVEKNAECVSLDPLHEEECTSVKGIVHKYANRVLWKVSFSCAAHCQFCTRRRQVGSLDGKLSKKDIKAGLEYIAGHEEIEEVILG